MSHRVTAVVGVATALAAMLIASPGVKASPLCEFRSKAHQIENGGFTSDNLWHIAHGDLPTCDDSDELGPDEHRDDRDSKSRYCRKRWYC